MSLEVTELNLVGWKDSYQKSWKCTNHTENNMIFIWNQRYYIGFEPFVEDNL